MSKNRFTERQKAAPDASIISEPRIQKIRNDGKFRKIGMGNKWEEKTLGNCADWHSGGTPSKSNGAYWSGSIPWVSAKDMKSFRLHDTEDHISLHAVGRGGKVVPAKTILLLVRGMTLHNDVPICMTMREMAFNQDIKALQPVTGVDNTFLAYWLLAHKPDLLASVDHAGHGTGRLVTETLKGKPVRLPPLSEQRAIASVLGMLDDKIENNRTLNHHLAATSARDSSPDIRRGRRVSRRAARVRDW